MSIDSSLKGGNALTGHRSVLKRDERIARLKETKGFDPSKGKVVGLPKTKNVKVG